MWTQPWPVMAFDPLPALDDFSSPLLEVVQDLFRQGCRHALAEDSLQLLVQALRWRLPQNSHMPALFQYQPVRRDVISPLS